MIKIKITLPNHPNNINISQFTGSLNNDYKNCKFFFNSDIKEVDFWFIIENLPINGDVSFVNPKNIFFLTAESSLPYNWYNKDHFDNFFSQFHEIFTCYPIYRKNVKPSIPFLPWMINSNHNSIFKANKRDKNFFQKLVLKKKKVISVICSRQQWQPGHQLRYNFVKKLKEYFGDKLDWYGNGVNPINQKWDGIAPYKYHIVLENRSDYNFITEKIYDSFLGGSFPIYWGAPNLNEYFPSKSFEQINILDFLGSIKKIEKIIASDLFENRLKELNIAKELVLNKYNLFNRISEIIENRPLPSDKKENISLKPSSYFFKKATFLSLVTSPKKQINIFAKILRIFFNKIIKLTDE
jgi:hypothetical protein